MRFPILMVDQCKLTPALGYVFDAGWVDPCESIISILWKFSKANALPGHIVAGLGIKNADPYAGVAPVVGVLDVEKIRGSLRISRKQLRSSLVAPSQIRLQHEHLRYCPVCLGRGYHCVLYQRGRLQVCPLHGTRLETACRSCGYAAPYKVSARLLDSPFSCADCGRPYGASVPSITRRTAWTERQRVMIEQLYFRLTYT